MERRIAICAVAQSKVLRSNTTQRVQGMGWEIVESLLQQTGLDFAEEGGIGTAISVSDDVYDARTISDNAMSDVLGAHFRCEEKVAQDGAQAVYYAVAAILSGHTDLVLLVGHCKESQAESRNQVTHLSFDPFYTRPLGLDGLTAAALQAQAYLGRSDVTEQHLAQVVVRARALAQRNPTMPETEPVTAEQVQRSPLLADPLRSLHCHPVSDAAVGLVLASAERARALTQTPVWITGVGNCMGGFYLGERDLGSSPTLATALGRALRRAGIAQAAGAFDLLELSDPYAHQLPLWVESLGLCPAGHGGAWIADGGPDRQQVNLSGGTLAGCPLLLGGLFRVAEATLQLKGEAGAHQAPNARSALAHGVMGPAGQLHSVVLLARD